MAAVDPGDPGGGDGGGTPTLVGYPATTDPYVALLRPHGRRVATAKVGTAGATHTTVGAALTAVSDAVLAFGLDGDLSWEYGGPDYGSDVFLGPGTYNETNGGGDWRTLVGITGDPADVVLYGTGGGGGTIHSFGSQYLENLTLRAASADGDLSPKYPWHITGGPVTIAVNCVFDVTGAVSGTSSAGGNRTAGLVGKDSSVLTVFYKCKFIGDAAAGVTGFNMHGGSSADLPETAIFLDCTTEQVTYIGSTGAPSLTGEKSKLYVIGLTSDSHMAAIAADPDTEVYTDTDLPVINGSAAIYRGVTEPPAIVDGSLPELNALYYPSGLADTTPADQYAAAVTDAAPMAPVPGRMYLTRVRLTEAQRIQRVGFNCTTAAGSFGARLNPADTQYVRDEAPTAEKPPVESALVVGSNEWKHYYAYSRYPGDHGIWTKVIFDSSTARVTGSASLPGLTDCFYSDDGVTLVPVAAGTPHPMTYVSVK